MGLETVELVMEIEDEFSIKISDSDAEKMRTVGDLVYLVLRLVNEPARPVESCPTASRFYRIRRGLIAAGVPRATVTPRASIGELVESGASTGDVVATLYSTLHGVVPKLEHSIWSIVLQVLIWLIGGTGAVWLSINGYIKSALIVLALTGIVWSVVFFNMRTKLRATGLVLGDLIRERQYRDLDLGNRMEIGYTFCKVREIVCEQFRVEEDQVSWDTRFIEDLNC